MIIRARARRFGVVCVVVMVIAGAACSSSHPTTTPATRGAGVVPAPTTAAKGPPTLRLLAARHNLLIGTAVADGPLRTESDYHNVLAREFNLVEAEDVMKWDVIHPAPHRYNFAPGDRLVAFARAHGMQVRGHNLAWFQANPPWLQHAHFTREQAIAVLRDHIQTVVGHYRGHVAQWDVVNEPLAEGDQGGLRDNIWLRWIGPDYINLAFQFAHQADPNAALYYNDYDWRSPGPKTDHIIALAQQLKQAGTPINGVGIQFHIIVAPLDQPAVAQKLRAIAALGLDVAITEADNGLKLPARPTALEHQARVFAELLNTCLHVNRCHTFNMWGFTDRHSWIPQFIPGYGDGTIYDTHLKPKPAYFALLHTLQ